jgi:phosphate-selective porin OprO/OprP
VVAANSQDDMERFRTRPEISLAPNYVDTGAYAADSAFYSHLEALLTMGSLSFQSELFHTYTDTIVGPDASFDALYLQGSWMLTGEHRPYNKKLGAAGRLIPNRNFSFRDHGSGAWELALRYSRTDLNGGLINGGRLSDITAGVNWYISPTLRAMVNYIHSHLDRNGLEGNSHIISSRVSIDF